MQRGSGKLVAILILISALAVAGCTEKNNSAVNTSANTPTQKGLLNIKSYAVYYGQDEIDKLSKYDLVILEPDNYSKDEIENLKANGTIVLAYLSVGEVNSGRSYFNEVKDCILGKNPVWNSYYVNVSCKKWREFILDKRISHLLNKGFDGVFLDTVDVVDVYPNMKKDMVDLIAKIRERYPDIVIIQNRGFSVIDETAKYVDGVLFECFTTRYDWKSGKYVPWSGDNLEWIDDNARKLVKLKEKYDIIVLTLDYADDESLKEICIEHAKRFGFIPFVSTIDLTTLPS
jgi:uncharacterized protein (TIGR01370 family)